MIKDGQVDEAKVVLGECVDGLFAVAQALTPFMPQTANTIQTALKADIITKAEPLFPRLGASEKQN